MNWKRILFAVPLLALSFSPQVEAKHRHRDDWNRRSERNYRNRYDDRYNRYQYQQRGYTGQDRNRDGAIDRYEWRGNHRSFERRDRNNDGRITPEDRGRNYRYDDRYYRR